MDIPRVLHTADLQAGDVLLHMGKGQISKLIAWVGDSLYSHVAVVYDDRQVMEAAASGVRLAPLAMRAQMVTAFDYVDVYRPSRLQQADRGALLASLQAALDVYLGRPYPMNSLAMLGITCAIRNKIPGTPELRLCLRIALDLVIANDPNQVVCSELVYRGFDEAITLPANTLRLPVIVRPIQNTPLPPIDLQALADEYIEDCRHAGHPALAIRPPLLAMAGHDPSPASDSETAGLGDDPADSLQIAQRLLQARAQLGLEPIPLLLSARSDAAGQNLPDFAPNPKTVLPADLQCSPGLQLLGRLAMAAA